MWNNDPSEWFDECLNDVFVFIFVVLTIIYFLCVLPLFILIAWWKIIYGKKGKSGHRRKKRISSHDGFFFLVFNFFLQKGKKNNIKSAKGKPRHSTGQESFLMIPRKWVRNIHFPPNLISCLIFIYNFSF